MALSKMFSTSAISTRSIFAAALLAATAMTAAGTANAGGFAIREQSAEFQGSSFAGAAAGGMGLSSMFWNPATIPNNKGWKKEINGSLVIPYSKATDERTAGGIPANLIGYSESSGNIGKLAFVPATYDSYQVNEMFWLGLAVNSPFGMMTKNGANSLGALYGYKSKIFTFNINPMVGVKLNDMISIGVGLQVNYMKGNLTTASLGTITSKIKGDDWGVGFTAGITFTPTDTTTIGIGYRSRVKHKLKGKFHFRHPRLGMLVNPATVEHTLPDMLTISLRQRIGEKFTLLGSVEWTNWSLFKNFDIESTPVNPGPEAYNWKDSWLFAVGGEYQYSDALTLRAGYAYEDSPVPDSTRGVRVPDNDRHWLSVGLSYVASDWLTMHAGYSHLFIRKGKVSIPAGTPPDTRPGLRATYKNHVDIVSVSATVDPAKFLSALGGH